MMEIIVVGVIVCLALFFVMRNLYRRVNNGGSACGCEGKLCPAKKKVRM